MNLKPVAKHWWYCPETDIFGWYPFLTTRGIDVPELEASGSLVGTKVTGSPVTGNVYPMHVISFLEKIRKKFDTTE